MHFQCPHIHANCLCTSLLCTQFNGHIMHHTAFWHHRQFQNQWIFLMLYMYMYIRNEVGGPTFSVYFWNIQLFSGDSIHVSLTKIHISNLEAFCTNIHNHLTYILVTCQVHVQCWSCWGPECCLWFSD